MALNLGVLDERELKPKITVFGVGGAGGNAVNNMISKHLEGAEFVVANTDAQAIEGSSAPRRIQLGTEVTQGLGAGMRPEVGREAAEETIDEIIDHLSGANMCFITAGMGGGTGTGAAPVIAKAARELGVLTVGVVTKPFAFEGARRQTLADQGIEELQQYVDTLIVIPNQNLFRIATENTTIMDAFNLADDVLYQGVKGVTDLMVMPGLINLDFADVRTVMGEMGKAMMGTGEATGETRAVDAAEKAIANPLLDDVSLQGARGVLINITGGYDLKLFEVDEAANRIKQEVDPSANIIVGSCFDEKLEGQMRVSVVATGIEAEVSMQPVEEAPEVAAPVSAPRRTVASKPAVDPQSGELRPAARHAVRRAAIKRPAAAARQIPAQLEDDFEIDEQSVAASASEVAQQVETDVVATQSLATGTDGPTFSAQPMGSMAGSEARKQPVATVIDPSVAESAPVEARAAAPAKRGLSALGGLNLIRKVADSFGSQSPSDAKKAPFKERRLDKDDDDEDGDLQIPAFLRRQAN
ncbi:UNVERIFIED_CONTAM: hypothetical protein GTU68_042806 [Idotea baltica]|nr:hypothetical protein [Idotea baltica]